MDDYKNYTTFYSKCGNWRITKHTEWSTEKPWVLYKNGTASIHFKDLPDAHNYFKNHGKEIAKIND